jgi:hypothetical protein
MVKLKKLISITFLLMGMLLLLMGCAEDEAPFQSVSPLQIVLQGPSGDVEFNAYVTFKWAASGGSGTFSNYSYTFGANPAVNTTDNTVTFENLTAGTYNFSVIVTDSKGATATSPTKALTVLADGVNPIATITGGPAEGSLVASGSSVTFNWSAIDSSTFGAIAGYTYKMENTSGGYLKQSAGVVQTVTATFDSLTAGPYVFSIGTVDNAGNTDVDSVAFDVQAANIIWIDDHDMGGLSAEFGEKMNDWAVAFNGFAWQEFDMSTAYNNAASSEDVCVELEALLNSPGSTVETVVWDESGTDDNYMFWYSTNGVGTRTPWLFNFLDNGGNLVIIGSNIMGQVYNTNPPAVGEFEDIYMGINTFTVFDTTVTVDTVFVNGVWTIVYDSTIAETFPWDDDDYVTLVGDTTLGYTNISIDVAKDEGTHQNGLVYAGLNASAIPILYDDDTGLPVGYSFVMPGGGKMVVLGMNLYYSPTSEITAVIQKLLADEFGH